MVRNLKRGKKLLGAAEGLLRPYWQCPLGFGQGCKLGTINLGTLPKREIRASIAHKKVVVKVTSRFISPSLIPEAFFKTSRITDFFLSLSSLSHCVFCYLTWMTCDCNSGSSIWAEQKHHRLIGGQRRRNYFKEREKKICKNILHSRVSNPVCFWICS